MIGHDKKRIVRKLIMLHEIHGDMSGRQASRYLSGRARAPTSWELASIYKTTHHFKKIRINARDIVWRLKEKRKK